MLEKLDTWDTELFLWLNRLHTPLMDVAMYWITDRLFWVPFYALIIFFLVRQFRWRGVWMVLAAIVAVGLADQVASSLFKPYFARFRPCHNPDIDQMVHLVRGCGGKYGFVSSHSSTTFALATLLWLLLRGQIRYVYLLFVWAFLVSYSRIYVGVHYPLDLAGGAAMGIMCAAGTALVYRKIVRQL